MCVLPESNSRYRFDGPTVVRCGSRSWRLALLLRVGATSNRPAGETVTLKDQFRVHSRDVVGASFCQFESVFIRIDDRWDVG
jgi:hypothetical protein